MPANKTPTTRNSSLLEPPTGKTLFLNCPLERAAFGLSDFGSRVPGFLFFSFPLKNGRALHLFRSAVPLENQNAPQVGAGAFHPTGPVRRKVSTASNKHRHQFFVSHLTTTNKTTPNRPTHNYYCRTRPRTLGLFRRSLRRRGRTWGMLVLAADRGTAALQPPLTMEGARSRRRKTATRAMLPRF